MRAEQQTIGTGSVAAYPGGPWGFGQPQGPGGAWPILGLTAAQREQIHSFFQEQQLAPVRQLMELQLQLQLRVALFGDPPDLGATDQLRISGALFRDCNREEMAPVGSL